MPGSLHHSREFRTNNYIGSDGLQHYAIVAVDGGTDTISYSSWDGLKQFGSTNGIPVEEWPEFIEYEFAIDIPIEEIESKSMRFRAALAHFDRTSPCPYWFERLLRYVDAGEHVFFC